MNYCYTPVRYGPTPGKRAIVDSRRTGTIDYTPGDFLQRSDKRENPQTLAMKVTNCGYTSAVTMPDESTELSKFN